MKDLEKKIKKILIDELMLDVEEDEIESESDLFGAEGLGLDSVDALQLAVSIEKNFGLKIRDSKKARAVFRNVKSIANAITKAITEKNGKN